MDPPVSRLTPLDIGRARSELGWEPRHTLEEALADYAGDFHICNG